MQSRVVSWRYLALTIIPFLLAPMQASAELSQATSSDSLTMVQVPTIESYGNQQARTPIFKGLDGTITSLALSASGSNSRIYATIYDCGSSLDCSSITGTGSWGNLEFGPGSSQATLTGTVGDSNWGTSGTFSTTFSPFHYYAIGFVNVQWFGGNHTAILYGDNSSGSFEPYFDLAGVSLDHYVLPLLSENAVIASSTMYWDWEASSTQNYASELTSAVSTWNNLTPIVIIQSSTSTSVSIVETDASPSTWKGRYTPGPKPSIALVELNTSQLASSTSSGIQNTITHELGHALGLDHSFTGNVMYTYQSSQTSLGTQDTTDYHYLWGN